ncbi:UNVERIFIED_ORG: hypothetical protein B2H95_00745 [Clostridium botulinum]|nr:hypothetical protein [Clostridium botulinum]
MNWIIKSYVASIRKEKINGVKIDGFLREYIRDTKKLIKVSNYSEAINRLKIIYYVLMRHQGQQKIESEKINFYELNKNNLINEKIIIETELGRRNGFSSDFYMNFILSSEIGIVTGTITGGFMSSDVLISKMFEVIGLMFIGILFLLIKKYINKKEKELLYSLCLDAVESLICDIP